MKSKHTSGASLSPGSGPVERNSSTRKTCTICDKAVPRVPLGSRSHEACRHADALGYDPISEADASAFVARRAGKAER